MKEARLDHSHLLAIREIIHWLRCSSAFILKHPQSLPQLAQRAPRDSHVARTNGACARVLQLDRTQKWSQALCQLEGKHTAQITVVAIGPSRAATAYLWSLAKKSTFNEGKGEAEAEDEGKGKGERKSEGKGKGESIRVRVRVTMRVRMRVRVRVRARVEGKGEGYCWSEGEGKG